MTTQYFYPALRHPNWTMSNGDKVTLSVLNGVTWESRSGVTGAQLATGTVSDGVHVGGGGSITPGNQIPPLYWYIADACADTVTPDVLYVAGGHMDLTVSGGQCYAVIYGGKFVYNTSTHQFTVTGFTTPLFTLLHLDAQGRGWTEILTDMYVQIAHLGTNVHVSAGGWYMYDIRSGFNPPTYTQQIVYANCIYGFTGSTFGSSTSYNFINLPTPTVVNSVGRISPVPGIWAYTGSGYVNNRHLFGSRDGTLISVIGSAIQEITLSAPNYTIGTNYDFSYPNYNTFGSVVEDANGNLDWLYCGAAGAIKHRHITSLNPLNVGVFENDIGIAAWISGSTFNLGGLLYYSGSYFGYHIIGPTAVKQKPDGSWINGAVIASVPRQTGTKYPHLTSSYLYYNTDVNARPNVILTQPSDDIGSYDQLRDVINLAWTFSDPEDAVQTNAEITVIEKAAAASEKWIDASGNLSDTREVLASGATHKTINANQIATSDYGYQVRVRASDYEQFWSPWSVYRTFSVASSPYVDWDPMASDYVMTSNHPTITWNYWDEDDDGCVKRTVRLYDVPRAVLFEDVDVLSSVPSGGMDSYTFLDYELEDDRSYSFGVTVTDTTGSTSEEYELPITTSINYPPTPTVVVTDNSISDGYVKIAVSLASGNYTHEIYRWSPRLSDYVSLGSALVAHPATYEFDDLQYPYGSVSYRVVTINDTLCTGIVDTSVIIAEEPRWILSDCMAERFKYYNKVMETRPVAYWRLGETAGTTLMDEVGLNNAVSAGAPTYGATSLIMDTDDAAIQLHEGDVIFIVDTPTLDCFEGVNPWTYAIWTNMTLDGVWRRLFYKLNSTGYATVGLHVEQNNILISRHGVNQYGGYDLYCTPPTSGATHLIVATFSGTQLALYIDGELGTPLYGGTNPMDMSHDQPTMDSAITIGSSGYGSMVGRADEITIWNRALSAAEIADLYETGSTLGWMAYARIPINIDSFKFKQSRYSQTYEPLGRKHIVSIENPVKGIEGQITFTVTPEDGPYANEQGYYDLMESLRLNLGHANNSYFIDPYGNTYEIRATELQIAERGYNTATVTMPFIETGAA
jgi:hypothetical protein